MKTYWGMRVKLLALLTSALHGGEWSASLSGRFAPGAAVPIGQEAGWAPDPVWTRWRGENITPLPLTGIEPR